MLGRQTNVTLNKRKIAPLHCASTGVAGSNSACHAVHVRPIAIESRPCAPNTDELTPGVTSGALTGGMGSPYSVNFGTYYPSVVPPPGETSTVAEKLAFTHYQLQSIRGDSELVDGLVLVSSDVGYERVEAGASQSDQQQPRLLPSAGF